ncbi:MAG: T9SS type A sorting domain-containing protein [Bacteroidales bacterium]|jgi:hypothetical protein|nr:T9SS type A sorting domain-containing protein [Bacteroidales bacterium]
MRHKLKIYLLSGLLFCGAMYQTKAQSSDTLYVNKTNNFAVSDNLDNISKLTFSATEMFVHKNSGVQTFLISEIKTITFNRLFDEQELIGIALMEENKLIVYPNPTDNAITIESNENIKEISVFDIMGRMLLQSKQNSQTATVSLSNCKAGEYFLQIVSEKGVNISKVIKK